MLTSTWIRKHQFQNKQFSDQKPHLKELLILKKMRCLKFSRNVSLNWNRIDLKSIEWIPIQQWEQLRELLVSRKSNRGLERLSLELLRRMEDRRSFCLMSLRRMRSEHLLVISFTQMKFLYICVIICSLNKFRVKKKYSHTREKRKRMRIYTVSSKKSHWCSCLLERLVPITYS